MANFFACLMIAAGCTVFGLSKRKRTGGVAFGLWTFAGIMAAIMGTVWACVTDASFKTLSQTSWYPYPSLHVSFYMHVGGYSLVLINTTIFGFLVLPDVWKFDPAQEKLDKLQRKMDRKKEKETRHARKKEELQRFIGQQQQGYGGYAPQPAAYGQVAPAGGYMQPMQQQNLKGVYGMTQGNGGMPVAIPGQQPQGYGAPPGQVQTGFGLAPAPIPQGYGGPGYGGGQPNLSSMPPGAGGPPGMQQGGTGGTGSGPGYGGGQPNLSSMPPGTGGSYGPSYGGGQPNLGAMPGAKRPPGPGGYNWPAAQGQPGPQAITQGAEKGGDQWNKMPSPPPSQQ
jgi:hypothetical protein